MFAPLKSLAATVMGQEELKNRRKAGQTVDSWGQHAGGEAGNWRAVGDKFTQQVGHGASASADGSEDWEV